MNASMAEAVVIGVNFAARSFGRIIVGKTRTNHACFRNCVRMCSASTDVIDGIYTQEHMEMRRSLKKVPLLVG